MQSVKRSDGKSTFLLLVRQCRRHTKSPAPYCKGLGYWLGERAFNKWPLSRFRGSAQIVSASLPDCAVVKLFAFCHVLRFESTVGVDHLERHRFPFVEGFKTLAFDRRMMDKDILTGRLGNETVTFLVIEPLHSAASHSHLTPFPHSPAPRPTAPTPGIKIRAQSFTAL